MSTESDRMPVIAVVGPTASGKTRRAVELARALNGEILSADSRQVYRGMTLGTGKDLEEYGEIPYHLIDICRAGEKYNLFRFLSDYDEALQQVTGRGHMPVLCGGTGMYVEAALNGMVMPCVPRNEELRSKLKGKDLAELTAILASMKKLHNTTDVDTVARALRAIEIQDFYAAHPHLQPVADAAKAIRPSVIIGIDVPRDVRRGRITRRLEQRLQQGMIQEVEALLADGLQPEDLIYYGLEYKWVTNYVTGLIDREQMFTGLETAIHQFAKRQMTWFRGMERRGHTIHWVPFDIETPRLIENVNQWLGELS